MPDYIYCMGASKTQYGHCMLHDHALLEYSRANQIHTFNDKTNYYYSTLLYRHSFKSEGLNLEFDNVSDQCELMLFVH